MSKDIKLETNASHPINLDSEEVKELEKLIESLKKEVVFPKKKAGEKPELSEAAQR